MNKNVLNESLNNKLKMSTIKPNTSKHIFKKRFLCDIVYFSFSVT